MLLRWRMASPGQTPRSAPCLTLLLMLLGFSSVACRSLAPSAQRYLVTATPINVVGVGHPGLCIAVDPSDAHGVWWWEPGPSGCSTRTTGPTILRAERAEVMARTGSSDVDVRFRLQLMIVGPRDIDLVIQDGGMRDATSGARVQTERRGNLDIPPAYGRF
jgi:hypothetical protein